MRQPRPLPAPTRTGSDLTGTHEAAEVFAGIQYPAVPKKLGKKGAEDDGV